MLLEVMIWLILLEVISFVSLPISMKVFGNLMDKGYAASKILGLALIGYLTWILSFFLGFKPTTILISFFILLSFSVYVVVKNRENIKKDISSIKRILVHTELAFLILFIIFCFLRAQNPDISYFEKFMDFAFLNAMVRSDSIPPPDPWFAGESINYYYFGHFISAMLTKLSGIASGIAYNLSFVAYYAIFSILVFSLAASLTKKMKYGILAIFIIGFLGNSFAAIEIMTYAFPEMENFFANTLNLQFPFKFVSPSGDFRQDIASFSLWPSTRLINETINEFPFASFIFGDLHSHYMSFPFIALALMLIYCLNFQRKRTPFGLVPFFISFSLAMLAMLNIWFFAAAFFVFMISILYNGVSKDSLSRFFSVAFISSIFFAPFFFSMHATEKEIAFADETIPLTNLLIFFSLPIFSICYYIIKKDTAPPKKLIALSFLLGLMAFALFKIQSSIVLFPIFAYSVWRIVENGGSKDFIDILIFSGTFLLFSTDLFFFESRMNNIFKIFLGVWIIYGIASAYIFSLFKNSRIFITVFLALLILNSLAPILVISNYFNSGIRSSLDGTLWMKQADPGAYYAIQWINENIKGSPVILEAPGRAYTYDSVISANTGLPTVIGWVNHEFLWRGSWYTEIERDANEIYSTSDQDRSLSLLKKYNVSYVYIGSSERGRYPPEGLNKFNDKNRYELVFSQTSLIYRVI